jgi:uncharacterized protein YbjT (DUF2867 family)
LLLARGTHVRAFVHRIDERSEHLRALGAEIVQGDFHDIASVEHALAGVSTVYFAYPVQAGLIEATAIMADAARRAGVKRIVDMVMLVSAPNAPTPRMRENYLSEQIFEWSGIPTTHVRATVFYENVRALVAGTLARDGSLLLPWGNESTVLPLVAGEDVARVVAGVLSGPMQASGTVVSVIGEVLSLGEMIAILRRVRGRDVRYTEITDQLWHEGALAHGLNAHAAEHLSALWRTLRNTQVRFAVTDSIEQLGGSRPKSFEQFVRAELAA